MNFVLELLLNRSPISLWSLIVTRGSLSAAGPSSGASSSRTTVICEEAAARLGLVPTDKLSQKIITFHTQVFSEAASSPERREIWAGKQIKHLNVYFLSKIRWSAQFLWAISHSSRIKMALKQIKTPIKYFKLYFKDFLYETWQMFD